MKLYLKDSNVLEIDSNTKLELLNKEEFAMSIQSISDPPSVDSKVGIVTSLRYILVQNGIEYLGESVANFTKRPIISNIIDDNSPYIIELVDWCLSKNKDMFYDFNIKENKKAD